MKVSHADDFDTHAVVGGEEVEEFEIAQTAEFFTVLSSTLYRDKPLAVAREVLCNAWDSHIVSGRQNTPVIVNISDTKLSIRDYGDGIPHNKIHKTYCVYGASTKKNDGNQTGGFGLGSKSPFAYSDHFTVDNHHDGLRTVHAISRGSAQTKGKPDRRVMVRVPTTQSGVEVTVPLRTKDDANLFKKLIRQVAYWGEMNVILNGEQLVTCTLSKAQNNLYLHADPSRIPNRDTIMVRYGNVLYPVREHDDITAALHKVETAVEKLPYHDWTLILQAAPNTISVAPSREDLSMTETTATTLNKLLTDILPHLDTQTAEMQALQKEQQTAAIRQLIQEKQWNKLFTAKNAFREAYGTKFAGVDGHAITDRVSLAQFLLTNEGAFYGYALIQEQCLIAELLIEAGHTRSHMLKKFLRFRSNAVSWQKVTKEFRQEFMQPLARSLTKESGLSLKNLNWYFPSQRYATARKGFANFLSATPEVSNMLQAFQGTVIIAHSKISVLERYVHWDEGSAAAPLSAIQLVYVAPRKKEHRDAAIAFFKRHRFQVLDFASWYDELMEQERSKDTLAYVPLPAVKKEKLAGLPSLLATISQCGHFIRNRHLMDEGRETRTTSYTHVVKPENLSGNGYTKQFFPWGDGYGKTIANLFGDQIGIVANSKQLEKQRADGKGDGFDYIVETICQTVLSDPQIRLQFELRKVNGLDYHIRRLIQLAHVNPVVRQALGLPVVNLEFESDVYNIFDSWRYNYSKDYYKSCAGWRGTIHQTWQIVDSWTVPAFVEPLVAHFKARRTYHQYLDLGDLLAKLINLSEEANPDINLKSYLEITLINALK